MAITLNTGYEFTTNEALSAAKLNAMMDDAVAFGMISSDLKTSYHLLDVATSQPTPTLGYPWIDNDGQLRFGNGTFFQYGSGVFRATNQSGGTLTRGSVVRLVPGGFTTVDSNGTTLDGRVFGVVLDASVNSGADAFLMYRGVCQVFIDAAFITAGGSSHIPGAFVYAFGLVPGTAAIYAPPPGIPDNFALFGVMLATGDASSFTPGLYVCKVFK